LVCKLSFRAWAAIKTAVRGSLPGSLAESWKTAAAADRTRHLGMVDRVSSVTVQKLRHSKTRTGFFPST
jgi:hypothetical protein